jgi:hypothetical protein
LDVGSAASDVHLNADPNLGGESFCINARQLLNDIELSFDGGFREWILKES